ENPNTDLYVKVKELYNQGMKLSEVRQILVDEYHLSVNEAKRVAINAKPTKYNPNKTYNDQAGKLLDIMSYKWISSLTDAEDIYNIITGYSDKIGQIHDGTIVIDTGDNFKDAIILIAVYASINIWKWFRFIFEDRYHRSAEAFSKMSINDILSYYTENAMNYHTFYSSKVMILKFMS